MKKLIGVATGIALGVVGLAGPAAAQTSGGNNENFTVIFSGSGNAPGQVIATGAFNGVGKDVQLGGENSNRDKFVFPGGTLFASETDNGGTQSFNPTSCVGKFTDSGTFTITRGTGEFKGVTGSGTYRLKGTFVADRNPDGSCSEQGGTSVIVIKATGNLNLNGGGDTGGPGPVSGGGGTAGGTGSTGGTGSAGG